MKDDVGLKVQYVSLVVWIEIVKETDFHSEMGNCEVRPLGWRKLKILEVCFDINSSREAVYCLPFGWIKRNGGTNFGPTAFLRKDIDKLMHRIHLDRYDNGIFPRTWLPGGSGGGNMRIIKRDRWWGSYRTASRR
jgi:hypothetical protein